MQPLSYQSAEESCWVTCMINGIRLVTRKNRVPTRAYRTIQCLLQNDGAHFFTEKEWGALENAVQTVERLTGLNINHYNGADVQNALLELQFDRRVAVCSVGNGDHSILLHNKIGYWFEGFDPYWYDEERCGGRLLRFPKGDRATNVRIHQRQLFGQGVNDREYTMGMKYHMGRIENRFLIVIEPAE